MATDGGPRPAVEQPLVGVRVIDISTSYAAPVATMYLADLGADVIKVERPGTGDDSRGWGPPFLGRQSAWFMSANRGKRSVALDIASEDGHRVLMRLLEEADVFVENLNPGKLARLGLEPLRLRARFPRLIYCSVSAFGLDGPESEALGYDLIAQARSGLMSVTGAAGGTPQRVSTALSDVVAGMLAGLTVAAALVRQRRTGAGDVIDVSLLEADLALMAPRIASFLAGDPEPRPSGGTDSVLALYQPFETADRPIVIAVGNDRMWLRFCEASGLNYLAADQKLRTNTGRREQRPRVLAAVAARLRERSAAEWLERFRQHNVPCAPIQALSEVVNDPQIVARDVITTIESPDGDPFQGVGTPWRLSSDDRDDRKSPPLLGEDGVDVLRDAGYDEREIESLIDKTVLWVPSPTKS